MLRLMAAEPAVFCYSEEDVLTALTTSNQGLRAEKSKFDELLCEKWDQAMSSGIFRYDLSEIVTRRVSGKYGFIVQRNPKRHTHRRAPAQMSSLKQPFDSTLFNFNKIKPGEVLFALCRQNGKDHQNSNHLMIVNVSPITYGHTLFVPDPQRCLPQVLTEESIRLCLEMVALSNHSGLCIVANSLLAYASVNHLHYHILYVEEPMLAAAAVGRHIHGCVYELLNHPSVGFGAELASSPQQCAKAICSVVDVFMEMNVPHNMVILKGSPFSGDKSACQVIKTILIPRKPHYGGKGVSEMPPPLCAAACELAQGFVPILDHSKYETITEDDILHILQEMMLSREEFQTLLEKVELLSPN